MQSQWPRASHKCRSSIVWKWPPTRTCFILTKLKLSQMLSPQCNSSASIVRSKERSDAWGSPKQKKKLNVPLLTTTTLCYRFTTRTTLPQLDSSRSNVTVKYLKKTVKSRLPLTIRPRLVRGTKMTRVMDAVQNQYRFLERLRQCAAQTCTITNVRTAKWSVDATSPSSCRRIRIQVTTMATFRPKRVQFATRRWKQGETTSESEKASAKFHVTMRESELPTRTATLCNRSIL